MVKSNRQKAIAAAVAAALSGTGGYAFAVDNFWEGDVSSDWNTAGNWSLNRVPIFSGADGQVGTPETDADNEDAAINLVTPAFPIITADLAAIPRDIFVGNSAGATGRVDHRAGSVSTGLQNWMTVGTLGGTGTYNLANTAATGGTLTNFGLGTGSLTVGGAGPGGRLYVGGRPNITGQPNGGNGTFNVNTSGTVTIRNDLAVGASGGTGVVRVDAGNITTGGWNFIGLRESADGGNGTLNMSGGSLTNTGRTYVATPTTTGQLNLSGGDYNNQNDELFIIGEGAGSNGDVTVTNAESTLNSGGELWVGQDTGGDGSLAVSAGAVTVNNWLAIGRNGGTGVVTVSGTGSISKTGNGAVTVGTGNAGRGTININAGSFSIAEPTTEANSNNLILGENGTGTGIVNQTGGTVTVGGDLIIGGLAAPDIGATGRYFLDGGILDMTGGAIRFGTGTAEFRFNGGTLRNVGSITMPLLTQTSGTISPGASPGTTTINGGYTMGALAEYDAEVAPGGASDLIDVNGPLTLGGTLDVIPTGTLAIGQIFTIMTYDSLTAGSIFLGHPDDSTFTENGVTFLINYNNGGNNVTLQVVPEPTALGFLGVGAAGMLLRRRRRLQG